MLIALPLVVRETARSRRPRPPPTIHRMRTLVEATHHYHIVGRNGTADLWHPSSSRTPDWRMGFGLQTARTGLRYRNPVIERTAISRVSKSFRGDLQPGKHLARKRPGGSGFGPPRRRRHCWIRNASAARGHAGDDDHSDCHGGSRRPGGERARCQSGAARR